MRRALSGDAAEASGGELTFPCASPQATLPFVVFTIVKTASALRPFDFNAAEAANAASGSAAAAEAFLRAQRTRQQQQQRRQHLQHAPPPPQQQEQHGELAAAADDGEQGAARRPVLCVLCQSPLSAADLGVQAEVAGRAEAAQGEVGPGEERAAATARRLHAGCCRSCRTQLLEKGLAGPVGAAEGGGGGPPLPGFVARRLAAVKVAQDW